MKQGFIIDIGHGDPKKKHSLKRRCFDWGVQLEVQAKTSIKAIQAALLLLSKDAAVYEVFVRRADQE